ncbi:hemerythrin-like metal-binding protein [Paramagnetospirillum caucaseum]|uniref:Hemerythrin-like metal-binding protein n=1 Tax=Paramagnetospirillum caucaseum TaxID=1244869 RepID=M2YCL0_9PROT|nr:bacteriohemerythrin [Paramagnetospirillum caucaseum]EME70726.1 hemerythrin-like metal-binding protein [Paramagnetospirillum caucaseum]
MEWNPIYEVGHPELDAEHRSLFEVLATLSQGSCETESVDAQIQVLEHYVVAHFDREEYLMAEAGYPFLAEHREQHEDFRATVSRLRTLWGRGDLATICQEIIKELSAWLSYHIIDADHGYKGWITMK